MNFNKGRTNVAFGPSTKLFSLPPASVLSSKESRSATKEPEYIGSAAILPGVNSNDVLCGRDKVSHAHGGNKRFRKVIESHRDEYQNASTRDTKTQITCRVIAAIQGLRGRFLKLDDATGMWVEVGDQYAREKVSHALRSAKDPHRPRFKKPRQKKQYVPTKEENALFRDALAEQQRIFRALVEGHANRHGENNDGDGDDDNVTWGDDAEVPSWDFYS